MGSHNNCLDWDYENHPERRIVTARSRLLDKLFRRSPEKFRRYRADTRRGHRFIFNKVAPSACKVVAGSFRGTKGTCLENYEVFAGGMACYPSGTVLVAMNFFEADCLRLIDAYMGTASSQPEAKRLLLLVDTLCYLLDLFFRIHPYANGNGHAGRMLILLILEKCGFHPVNWTIDGKREYTPALMDFRNGNRKPLQKHFLKAIRGN